MKTLEEIYKDIKNNSSTDKEFGVVYLGDLLELKINFKEKCVDIYKAVSEEESENEEHDWDEDFLTTVYL